MIPFLIIVVLFVALILIGVGIAIHQNIIALERLELTAKLGRRGTFDD